MFSARVVSILMILDRYTDAISDGIASIAVVARRIAPILLWGALIVALVRGAFLLPWSVRLLVVDPLLGHVSWQAYRASICWPTPEPD